MWRQRLQRAYNRPEYDEALAALQSLQHELEDRNQSAAGSLAEGLDETLTLHRLGVYGVLGRSLKTTNGLESINALIEERCAKVDHWQNSSQRHRWLATALLDIEPRLRKVMGYRHLPRLRDALKRELKIDTTEEARVAPGPGFGKWPSSSIGGCGTTCCTKDTRPSRATQPVRTPSVSPSVWHYRYARIQRPIHDHDTGTEIDSTDTCGPPQSSFNSSIDSGLGSTTCGCSPCGTPQDERDGRGLREPAADEFGGAPVWFPQGGTYWVRWAGDG